MCDNRNTRTSPKRQLSLAESATISAISPAVAVFLTNPFDVAKVRMQLQGEGVAGQKIYRNSFDCMWKIWNNEGFQALYKGITPAVYREGSKNIFRIGMFDPLLNVVHDPNSGATAPTWKRVVVGSICGAMGAVSCNPFELAKTRLQSAVKTTGTAHVGYQHGYSGLSDALLSVIKRDGFLGLYRGSMMSMARSLVGSGANMSTYSLSKEFMVRKGFEDSAWVDIICGFYSAFWSVLCMNPIDTLRTRLYNQPTSSNGTGLLYTNGFDAFKKVTSSEGYGALYKGFVSHFLRIGPHFALSFCFVGVLRRAIFSYKDSKERALPVKTSF